MNILITRFPYISAPGGEEWHTIELAKALKKKGHKIFFMGSCNVLLKMFENENFPTKKIWGGKMVVTPIELIKFFILWSFISWNLGRHFRKFVKENKITHLYCLSLNEKILLTSIAKKLGIKTVWVEHQQIRGWLTKSPLKKIYKKWSRHVKIIPISPWNKKRLKEISINKKNIIEIPNGIEPLGIRKEKKHQKKFKIGCASRLIPKKGINQVVRAAAILEEVNKNISLDFTIIGEGPEKENLKRLAKHLDLKNISLLGRLERNNYKKEFLSFDIFILPSLDRSETFGLVAAEAMGSGIPVILTNVCGIAYYLKNKKNAIIIPPGNNVLLAEKILELTSDKKLYNKLVSNGRKIVQKKFSFDTMVNAYEKILKN